VHYNNDKASLETTTPDKRTLEELSAGGLTGPVVFIDISGRVQAELDKNSGKPGAKAVTDFASATNNVVTAADIADVVKEIRNGI
jgi:hypothetical protein